VDARPLLEDVSVPFPRAITAAIVACAVSFLPAGPPVSAQGAQPTGPSLKPAKERGTGAETEVVPTSGSLSKQQRMRLCLESWDAQTHMSRSEWRLACERTVKDYPDAYR
jgi:hypothetical protein